MLCCHPSYCFAAGCRGSAQRKSSKALHFFVVPQAGRSLSSIGRFVIGNRHCAVSRWRTSPCLDFASLRVAFLKSCAKTAPMPRPRYGIAALRSQQCRRERLPARCWSDRQGGFGVSDLGREMRASATTRYWPYGFISLTISLSEFSCEAAISIFARDRAWIGGLLSEIASSSMLMPDQQIRARTVGDHHHRIKHLP